MVVLVSEFMVVLVGVNASGSTLEQVAQTNDVLGPGLAVLQDTQKELDGSFVLEGTVRAAKRYKRIC